MNASQQGGGRMLPISLMNPERFLSLFYEPIEHEVLAKNTIHVHILRIDAGDFALEPLFTELSNISMGYVLSRQKMEKVLTDPSRMVEYVNKVKSQFKTPDSNAGEGGELLLYAFLEAHLGAPKILSKMELKTSTDHYIHGSDGVHLLEVSDGKYHLIFGESKMYGDPKDRPGTSANRGIKAAFKSVGAAHASGFGVDVWLVESEILKETLDPSQVEALAAILLPAADGDGAVEKANAFGIFVGYELDVTAFPFAEKTTSEIETYLRDLAAEAIVNEVDTIKAEINNRGLGGYCFHIYAVPFLKRNVNGAVLGIEDVRIKLAEHLSGRSAPV